MSHGNPHNGQPEPGRPTEAWDELLSAYIDGEVSNVERELVERRMREDPAIRRALEEWQALSLALKTLPRPAVPDDLQPAILKATTHPSASTTSQAASQVATPASVTPAPVGRNPLRMRRREWLAGACGLVLSLLAVALIPLQWLSSPTESGVLFQHLAFEGHHARDHAGIDPDGVESNLVTFGGAHPHNRLNDGQSGATDKDASMREERFFTATAPDFDGLQRQPQQAGRASAHLAAGAAGSSTNDRAAVRKSSPQQPEALRMMSGAEPRARGAGAAAAGPTDNAPAAESFAAGIPATNVTMLDATTANVDNPLPGSQALRTETGSPSLEPWQEVQPYLNLLTQNTSAVANFDLIVLDVKQSADQFQVLLMQNGVVMVDESDETGALATLRQNGAVNVARTENTAGIDATAPAEKAASEQTGPEKPGSDKAIAKSLSTGSEGLIGVYVEADGEPITLALQEMVRQRQVIAMKLQPPLQLDAEITAENQLNRSRSAAVEQELVANEIKRAYQTLKQKSDQTGVPYGGSAAMTTNSVSAASPDVALPAAAPRPGNDLPQSAAAQDVRRRDGLTENRGGERALARNSLNIDDQFGNYNRRLHLSELADLSAAAPSPLAREMQGGQAPGTAASPQQMRKVEEPTAANALEIQQMTRNTTQNTVRVLFVLQPVSPQAVAPSAPTGSQPAVSTPAESTPVPATQPPAAPKPRP